MNTVITQSAVKSRGGNMAANEITFSPEKALEAILHIAAKLNIPTIHEVLKVRYFADKLHLQQFGWMASGDDYVAMKFGPVGSGTYNLMKAARGDESGFIHPRFAELVNGSLAVEVDRRTLRGLRTADLSRLSLAEVSCLDSAVESYGNMPFDERTELSHDAAWKLAWDEIGASPMAVASIAKTLNNASELLIHMRA
jgi:uncharacterized phage-associated protein